MRVVVQHRSRYHYPRPALLKAIDAVPGTPRASDAWLTLGLEPNLAVRLEQLLRWQWEDYPKYHQSRSNLVIHVVAVPLFLLGTVALVGAIARLSAMLLAIAVACIVVSVALQGRGHRSEPVPPAPFNGPLNFLSRLFFEQWVTFPRFVFSGRWLAALRSSAREP